VYAVTWLPKGNWEVTGKFMYNMKQKNGDTNVKSGDEFHMDYLVGKKFGDWGVGLAGYYLKQMTNDKPHHGANFRVATRPSGLRHRPERQVLHQDRHHLHGPVAARDGGGKPLPGRQAVAQRGDAPVILLSRLRHGGA
jgi:hypothetical protein